MSVVNVSIDANHRRQFSDLWNEYKLGLLPPKKPGRIRIDVTPEPAMQGPDTRNMVTYIGVPREFLPLLKTAHIPYEEN
jgi:hypothetical protein